MLLIEVMHSSGAWTARPCQTFTSFGTVKDEEQDGDNDASTVQFPFVDASSPRVIFKEVAAEHSTWKASRLVDIVRFAPPSE